MREQVRTSSAALARDADQRYEYLLLTVAPHERLSEARARLTEHAEYGKWELTRSVLLYSGARKYWLRRRVMRVEATI